MHKGIMLRKHGRYVLEHAQSKANLYQCSNWFLFTRYLLALSQLSSSLPGVSPNKISVKSPMLPWGPIGIVSVDEGGDPRSRQVTRKLLLLLSSSFFFSFFSFVQEMYQPASKSVYFQFKFIFSVKEK